MLNNFGFRNEKENQITENHTRLCDFVVRMMKIIEDEEMGGKLTKLIFELGYHIINKTEMTEICEHSINYT